MTMEASLTGATERKQFNGTQTYKDGGTREASSGYTVNVLRSQRKCNFN